MNNDIKGLKVGVNFLSSYCFREGIYTDIDGGGINLASSAVNRVEINPNTGDNKQKYKEVMNTWKKLKE